MSMDKNHWLWNPEVVVRVQEVFGSNWEPIFRLLTLLTDSAVILILIAALFWTLGRRTAYTVLAAAMLGALIVMIVKVGADVPRPDHPDLIVYESRISPSFPSGHAMYAVGFWGTLVYLGIIRWPLMAAILITASLSRLYLGIHFPGDLVAGAMIGLFAIVLGLAAARHLFVRLNDQHLSLLVASGFLGSVAMVPLAGEFPLGWEILGGLLGAGIGTLIEIQRVHYEPRADQANAARTRLAVGGAGVFLLLGLGASLRGFDDAALYRTLIFMPLGLWAMWIAPLILHRMGHSERNVQATQQRQRVVQA